jgi:flagellar biosynthesis protein FlhG
VLDKLLTEQPNPASASIDTLPTEQALRIINAEDRGVAAAVEREIPSIARAVDAIVAALEKGGRLFYLGAGTSVHTLDFFLLADHGVLVVLPEPTSVENAYRFLKAALFRRLQHTAQTLGVAHLAEAALGSQGSAMRTPAEVVKVVAESHPEAAAQLERSLREFRVKLVVNQVRAAADESVGPAVASAWKKFFGLEMDYLGGIAYDDAAWRAVRKRRPLVLEGPDSEAARQLVAVAARLDALDRKGEPG